MVKSDKENTYHHDKSDASFFKVQLQQNNRKTSSPLLRQLVHFVGLHLQLVHQALVGVLHGVQRLRQLVVGVRDAEHVVVVALAALLRLVQRVPQHFVRLLLQVLVVAGTADLDSGSMFK